MFALCLKILSFIQAEAMVLVSFFFFLQIKFMFDRYSWCYLDNKLNQCVCLMFRVWYFFHFFLTVDDEWIFSVWLFLTLLGARATALTTETIYRRKTNNNEKESEPVLQNRFCYRARARDGKKEREKLSTLNITCLCTIFFSSYIYSSRFIVEPSRGCFCLCQQNQFAMKTRQE